MKKIKLLILCLSLVLSDRSFAQVSSASDPIADLKPGEWLEIPNSRLFDVRAPEDSFATALCGGIEGISGIINDWCSGALDTKRNRFLIGPAGGHHGYSGNEVYAFDLNDLKWRRITNPEPLISCKDERPDPNLFPGAMHTYDGLEYMPEPIDRYAVVDMWGDRPVRAFYSMNMTSLKWTAHNANPKAMRTGDVSAYDVKTQQFYFGSPHSGKIVAWDPVKDTCIDRVAAGGLYYQNATVDPKRNLFVSVGHNAPTHAIPITVHPAPMPDKTIKPTGDKEFEKMVCPGLEYDAVSDKMVGWAQGTDVSKLDVYTLDLDEKHWMRHKPSRSNKVTPSDENMWGTWGRWRYVPAKNIFVLYNDVRDNVFIYKFTSWRDTVAIKSIQASAVNTIEQYLTIPITVVANRIDNGSDTISNSCSYISLDTSKAITNGNYVIARNLGTVKVLVRKSTAKSVAYDTISLVVVPSTAILDLLQISVDTVRIFAADSFQVHATGYFHKGTQKFSRNINKDAQWSISASSVATVSNGMIRGLSAGGSAAVVVSMNDLSKTVWLKVWPKLSFAKRINFQVSSTPWKYGWEADNGGDYSSAKGYGWLTGTRNTQRDDRAGKNFLLKSFVIPSPGSQFKINVPDGNYIIKIAMGDNIYGVSSQNWVLYGNDTVCVKRVGTGNGINISKIKVSGGNGAVFSVTGAINYIVMISDEGTAINEVAEDDGTVPTLTPIKNPSLELISSGLQVSPNPFSSILKINIPPVATQDKNSMLQIFDFQGRCVADLTDELSNKSQEYIEFDAKGLNEGLFIIRLSSGNKIYTRKVTYLK